MNINVLSITRIKGDDNITIDLQALKPTSIESTVQYFSRTVNFLHGDNYLKNYTIRFSQQPLLILILLCVVRLIVSSLFIKHSYYADEFNDYFTTAHGLVFSHTLGEWYLRTDMRSYVIIQPLVLILQLFKAFGIKSLFLQFEGTKLAIGLFSIFGLYFAYQFAILRWADKNRAFIIGLVYILHPLVIFYNQSLSAQSSPDFSLVRQ